MFIKAVKLQENYVQQSPFPGVRVVLCAAIKIMLWLFHKACVYRVIMDVTNLLKNEFRIV